MDRIINSPHRKVITLKAYDVELIHAAKDILINEMDNPVTIIELAHKVWLNDFKLKSGFKQEFGTTIFNYQQEFNKFLF